MAFVAPAGDEYLKMIAGEPYLSDDPELRALRLRARSLAFRFNSTPPEQAGAKAELLRELFGEIGQGCEIETGLHVDYGLNTRIGDRFYANANCVLLDVAPITIGDDVMLAPAVQLLAATHPVDPVERTSGLESGAPITLGNRVWLGGGTVVGPGVTIGDDTVVGSGAVVIRDLPAGVVAVGNPARILREV